jgi:hypothetical protein
MKFFLRLFALIRPRRLPRPAAASEYDTQFEEVLTRIEEEVDDDDDVGIESPEMRRVTPPFSPPQEYTYIDDEKMCMVLTTIKIS